MENNLSQKLIDVGEYFAAELFRNTDRSPLYRYSCAFASYFEHLPPPVWEGTSLYPCNQCINYRSDASSCFAVRPDFSYTIQINGDLLNEKLPEAIPFLVDEFCKTKPINTPHTIGGAGFTHSFLRFDRILKDGLCGYRTRVQALPSGDFKDALLRLIDGISTYLKNCISYLRKVSAPAALIEALGHSPEQPPRSVYEAMVAWNFMYYIDGCDDPGRMDRGLLPYWKGEDIRPLLREFFCNVDANEGWSMPLGPDYNALTVQILDSIHHLRRPNMQLLVTPDMPTEIWEAVYRSIGSASGQPSLYNWEAYQREVRARIPEVSEDDRMRLAFGGCTETMIEGMSNVGSDDAGINTALIFQDLMRGALDQYDTFDAFLERFITETERVIGEVCGILEEHRKTRAQFRPQPVRTLFVDDCIDRMKDFNAGGARYNWSVINVAGLINVIDSMQVIRALIFDEQRYTPAEFLEKLDARDPIFLAECAAQPKHGNDDPAVNALATMISARIYGAFEQYTCTPGGRYYTVSNQFITYEYAGIGILATPDGRGPNEPLCDSCGAVRGRDKNGPTALLSSVAALRLDLVLGTPITNFRISKRNLPTHLKPLVLGFFEKGGMQLQITCASREELLDALEHPEKHENLVVRIGGYSEYFNRLSPTLKQTVIDRTEY